MASSDNLMTMEPWVFRSAFNDAWFPEMFTKETETLTKALQNSFSNTQVPEILPTVQMGSPGFQSPSNVSAPTVSGGSENDSHAPLQSKQRSCTNGVSKKITKRKPRASKRASTTYITADVDSFRQMVQQVTGVRMGGNGHLSVGSVLKPEPRRPVDRIQPVNCLPTLDTSAFLLDHSTSFMAPPPAGNISVVNPPSTVVGDGGLGSFSFDSFSAYPTLESWERNVMQ